jgi:crooked neck
MSKIPQVKNRSAAAIQITAEQLLRIANNQGIERVEKAPTQFITDREELLQYQQTKRKDFEDQLRRSRQFIGIWCKYALWEASQKEYERARSVFERALDVDYRNQTLWLKYADMEMKNKFVNHARNVWDRAVTLHPRVDTFWYKYSYMEELLGAVDNARAIFERWMAWDPDDLAWAAYIKFEMRQGQIERARGIYERYIALLPTCRAYLKYAKWEEQLHQRSLARIVYERALAELHPQERTEKLLVNFARFEERCKEIERARVIYQYALSQLEGNDKSEDVSELKKEFIAFEKRHGDKANIENAIVAQRREHYNQLVKEDIYDYDAWFDFIRLEENESDAAAVREVYNRAVACVPPVLEKRYWRRYVYLWINYAIYEELTAKDVAQTREVYRAALQVIPHKKFTFGKIWLMAAHFEVRQKDLAAARKLLGQGIGKYAPVSHKFPRSP